MGGLNTQLSSSLWTPMVSIQILFGAVGAGLTDFRRRVILWGHKMSTGTAKPNTAYALNTQIDANLIFGITSDIAEQYAHLSDQLAALGGGAAEVYGVAVAEPSGAKATHLIKIVAKPSEDGTTPGVNTSAQAAGYVDVYVGGWKHTVDIASGDTFAVIAAAIATRITTDMASSQNPNNTPLTSAAAGGTSTVTLTANHVGLPGNDLPVRVEFSDAAMGLAASPGTVTFANNATGDGLATIVAGSQTIATAFANGDTPSQIAAKVVAQIKTDAYNVDAFDNTGGVVVLLYPQGQEAVVMRISASITAAIGTTIAAAVGTAGTGVPSISTPLTSIRALGACGCWVWPWVDATTIATLETEITLQNNAINMKDQQVFMGSTDSLVNAGLIVSAPTPALTTSPYYAVVVSPDDSIRGMANAARAVAMVIASDQPNDNWDGARFQSAGGRVPSGMPRLKVRLDPTTTANTAMVNYHLTPVCVTEDGYKVILRAVTTVQAADQSLTNWGVVRGLGWCRFWMRVFIAGRFFPAEQALKKLLKTVGRPQSEKSMNPEAIAEAVGEGLDCLEQGCGATTEHLASPADVIDGADDLRKYIVWKLVPGANGRVDATFPTRVPGPLHQVGLVEKQQG